MAPRYPSIPEPTLEPTSLRDSILSIKQMLEVLTGQRGNHDYAAVTFGDASSGDAPFVVDTGDTMTGDLTINKANPQFNLVRSATTEEAGIYGWNGTTRRWKMVLGDATPETGGNAGSDFYINSRDDAGTLL